ncbi:DUF3275 family protein [Orbus sturtevantii]|uniref:DUF3275 family protein n=1 Tax=Orbus sturtevantii TaxID=3074109 RepID=UPI00370D2DD6
MISLPGTLIITQINGKYGAFNKAKLTTSIGSFTIKDKRIEQYEEGKYEGTFVIVEIKPYSYMYQNRASFEILARLNEMELNGNALLTDEDISLTTLSEHDPASDEQRSFDHNNCHAKKDTVINESDADDIPSSPVNTQGTVNAVSSSAIDVSDEELFGVLWPLGDEVRLDSTEDRLKLRNQTARLKSLNYQFDYKTQIWTKTLRSTLHNTKTTLPAQF